MTELIKAKLESALAGRYAIDREIGRGGMATVYLARDLKHDRRVALKVLDPELGAALGAERFLSEIRVTANLQHPNLLPLFDSGEADGLLFYVMPYVEGESLRHWLNREKQLPIDETVRIAVSVCAALDYAHSRGVVHRDLKPENILLQHGQPVVADFGIALAISHAGVQRVTQTGLSLGTPQYMSPEQATGDRAIDGSTDIYSLGAVAYEMLAGEPPHAGATAQAVIARLMTEEPRSITSVRHSVPEHVDAAIHRALEKLPADRFSSGARFAEALQGAGPPSGARTKSATRWRSAAVARHSRPVPWLIAVAALVAAGLALRQRTTVERVERYDLTTLGAKPMANSPTTYVGPTLALSADGARLAFVRRDSLNISRVWIRDIDDLDSRPVSGTEAAESVALSPDGNHLAFIRGSGLFIAPIVGGGVTTLVPRGAIRPWWSGDGKIYFGSLSVGGERIARIPASGGTIEFLAPPAAILRDPSPLPGSKAILVTRVTTPNVIGVVSLADGKFHALGVGHRPQYVAPGFIVYMDGPNFFQPGRLVAAPFDAKKFEFIGPVLPVVDQAPAGTDVISQYAVGGDKALLYMSGSAHNRELMWVDRTGATHSVDTTFQGRIESPALSPDGSRVAVGNGGSIWVKRLDSGSAFNLSVGGGAYPAWTPDGRRVSYYATDSGTAFQIVLKPADGSDKPTPVSARTTLMRESSWSPDGRWLVGSAYTNAEAGARRGIYGLRPGIDSVPIPLVTDSKAANSEPALSPDGHWLAFASNQTGPYEVYVVPFPNVSGARWLVSADGGTEPAWSPDGRELFYRDANDNMVSARVSAGEAFTVERAATLFSAVEFYRSEGHRQYDVSHEGKTFLMIRPVSGGPAPRVVLVKNWLQAARARAGK
ncbi:MAG: hypothetical protein JWM41_1774 [Gemmatimonadetes bacterium]|nr:hypothetical protein [Gemmatimonadota bacterium]